MVWFPRDFLVHRSEIWVSCLLHLLHLFWCFVYILLINFPLALNLLHIIIAKHTYHQNKTNRSWSL